MAYGIPILSILLVLPAAQITSLGGFVDAIKTVFTVYGGQVTQNANGTVTADLTGLGSVFGGLVALGFIWALLSSGATWLMGADRAQAVACCRQAGAGFDQRHAHRDPYATLPDATQDDSGAELAAALR